MTWRSFRTFRPIFLHVVYCLPAHVGDSFWRSLDPPFIHFNSTTNKGERSGHLHGGTTGFDLSRKLVGGFPPASPVIISRTIPSPRFRAHCVSVPTPATLSEHEARRAASGRPRVAGGYPSLHSRPCSTRPSSPTRPCHRASG